MKKLAIISTLVLLLIGSVDAQTGAKSLFMELGGPGLASINYDMRFGNKDDGFGGRVGIGGFTLRDNSETKFTLLFIPVGVNYLLGGDGKNYLELGAGVTPVVLSSKWDGDKDTFSGTFGHLIVGYRSQPLNSGFSFRAFICPIFGSWGFIPYYLGLSFGYKFGGGAKVTVR
jgi:hypothetical protein